VPFLVVLVGLGLLVEVVQMARGDNGPGSYAPFLFAGLIAVVVGLWFLGAW
jgi:hypothetical protein